MSDQQPRFPGLPSVINGNGAIAHVMRHVCGGVIGYPITPSTEISELFEAARAEGGVNVWGKHPFFFEPEGEHSAQSGALGAALTGGQFISNASSSQGILYAMESHYVTVGKKTGGFVLQVAARVVSKHSLNVMAGHDDVYALLSAGYTILFGSNPQEAADLAAISYRSAALSLIPVANSMDGFSTSHMLSEALMPEPELLREYLGDPAGRVTCPTVAQEMLFGAKGRVFQLNQYLDRHRDDLRPADLTALQAFLADSAEKVEADNAGDLVAETLAWVPEELHGQWRRQWRNSLEKGTRQMVPALVDVNNPGLTGPVQNQPDFQAGAVDHRTHFANAVPSLVRQAMDEYSDLTGRTYAPVLAYDCEDADYVMVGLGSITDDVRAVLPYLRSQGLKVGVVSVKMLQPFPEAELVAALSGAKAVTVLERSDQTALTSLVTSALFKARANAEPTPDGGPQYDGIPALSATPRLTTAIFGLGGHDVQPRHLIAAFQNMVDGSTAPLIYLGSQFFSSDASTAMAEVQSRMRAAYPETELMALDTKPNPRLLPESAMRIRFHSVGGYGTIATGKLLTDILAGVLGMHSKSAPKYGSEKSGAPTNYYITLSPEPVLITNAELEEVEVVISPDHRAFIHTNPLKGLVEGGTFMLQSDLGPAEVWRELPRYARRAIRERHIRFVVVDAFAVAKRHAPTPDLETRMMGIAFIGAVAAHVDRVSAGASQEEILAKVQAQIIKKFGGKGTKVVEGNMAVIREGIEAAKVVDYDAPEFVAIDDLPPALTLHTISTSSDMCGSSSGASALFDPAYYEDLVARPFREGTIGEAPVLPGVGLFMPAGTAAGKDKGLFRRTVPEFHADLCTGCMECALVCPDAAIPNTVHEIHDLLLTAIKDLDVTEPQREALRGLVYPVAEKVRESYRADKSDRAFTDVVAAAVAALDVDQPSLRRTLDQMVTALAIYPVARTRPFFDAMENTTPGTGGLFAATIDPWKCTGCLECIEVCGPSALTPLDQDADVLNTLQERFEFSTALPTTPKRFSEGAIGEDGELKRLMLERPNFYSTSGGHGACRGCGEVTAIRLVMATSHAVGDARRRTHLRQLEALSARLADKLAALDPADSERRTRIESIIDTIDKRLYLYEGGPTGNGPAPIVIANATGCSSVYASTMPYNSYLDPWVNSLFQDSSPLAKGIFEGICAQAVPDVRAMRLAELELADAYDPADHELELRMLSWEHFTPEELHLLPTVMTIGGDGATYDIGFGALSRVLASDTPIKALVLNSGAYSNTGGQASTSSYTGQDSDLARFGGAHHGKHESRKELGLLASFHPNVFACSTSTAMHAHFMAATMAMIDYPAAAVMDVYTPCGSEHGIPEASSNARARLAVESRMHPLFVHDPRRGSTLHDWFSLDGNPDIDKTWTTSTLEYLDEAGQVQLLTTPLTPAVFALGEVRFSKQFTRLAPELEDSAVPIEEYVEMTAAQRGDRIPFIHATDGDRHLIKVACSDAIVHLVEDRRRYWQTMQYLSGVHEAQLTALHRTDIEELRAQYEQATTAREASLDDIAAAMAELATSSRGSVGMPTGFGAGCGWRGCRPRRRRARTWGAHHRGRGGRGAGPPGPRGRAPVQRLRHLLPGAAAVLREGDRRDRRAGPPDRPDDPRGRREGRGHPGDRQADLAGQGHLRRGDHPMTTAEGAAGSDAQVALLARRLQREPRAFREVFISEGMAAIAYEFQQPELGPEFTRALWATLLREDDSATLMMRFLWDLPLGKKRTFIRAIDRELGERYPMFDGLSVDWPAGNSIPPYIRGAEDRAHDFGLVNKGYLGYMDLGYTAREVDLFVWLEAMRDKQCSEKPCELGIFLNECKEPTGGCPVQIHIPEMIEMVGTGRFREALALIESCNPLPDVTGRVCPQELQCQGVCLQNKMPIAIGQLEWFLPEREKLVNPGGDAVRFAGHRDPWEAAVKPPVAIVGSGPSGLINAYLLAAEGFPVTVFEAFHALGGVLRYGIPEFRLPNDLIDDVVGKIRLLGGRFVQNFVVGKTATLQDLRDAGFHRIFVGTGAGLPRFMNVPGEHLLNVMSANEFLTRVNLMQGLRADYETPLPETKGKEVLVIGGGNTAMDAARTAQRLGGNVTIVYRRTRSEMPARVEELHHALEEGIALRELCAPSEFLGDDKTGFVTAATLEVMELGEPDESGRRRPVSTGRTETMHADLVIMALGNAANPIIKDSEPRLNTSKWGTIVLDHAGSQETTLEGVFTGGDAARGGSTAIAAAGDGRAAANEILGEEALAPEVVRDMVARALEYTELGTSAQRILARSHLSDGIEEFTVQSPLIAAAAQAGQFVRLLPRPDGELIPLTLADWDVEAGTICLVVQGVGTSSIEINAMEVGDSFTGIAGPLGRPSDIHSYAADETVVFTAGGLGLPPVYPIMREHLRHGNHVTLISGFRSAGLMFWTAPDERVGRLQAEFGDQLDVVYTTNDGSFGVPGFVTGPLEEMLEANQRGEGRRVAEVVTIGPPMMMRAVSDLSMRFGTPCVASLNSIMVDATGMCGACMVPVVIDGKMIRKHACIDGPEIDSHIIDWDKFLPRFGQFRAQEAASRTAHGLA